MPSCTPETYERMVEIAWRESLPTVLEVRAARGRLHRKAIGIAALLAVSYYVLVLSNAMVPIRLAAAAAFVVAAVALATSVMHDANHGSFSTHRRVNSVVSYTSDALGASSWLWRIQHNRLHHGNTNVVGFDADVELAPWARLAPSQPWRRWYRWQHIYVWPLYGFLAIKNLLVSDLLSLVQARIGRQPLRREVTGGVIARVVAGKAGHIAWALVVPLLFNPWQTVLAFYFVCSWLVGFTLAVVFQLAHCVEAADYPDDEEPRRGPHLATHQMRTTVNVVISVPVVGHFFRWLVGGLDHQIEHHLAPGLPHTMYPIVAKRFRSACAARGIEYKMHNGLGAAVGAHRRWLRTMGQPNAVAVG